MKSVCRNLGAALGRIILAPHSVAPIEIVTPICSAEVVIHRHLHGFPGRLPSLPSAACVYPEIRSTGRGVRPDSLSAVKSGSSPFSTFIPSKVGGGIGTFGLRCGASERTHSGMDGSAESNPAAGKRDKRKTFEHKSESQHQNCHIIEKKTVTLPSIYKKRRSSCVPQSTRVSGIRKR